MADKKRYIVTDKAGPRPQVNGTYRDVGDVVELTDNQAEGELSRRVIELEADYRLRTEGSNPPAADGKGMPEQNADEKFNAPLPEGLGAHAPIGGIPGAVPDEASVQGDEDEGEDKADAKAEKK